MVRTKQTSLESNASVPTFRFPPNVRALSPDQVKAVQASQRKDKARLLKGVMPGECPALTKHVRHLVEAGEADEQLDESHLDSVVALANHRLQELQPRDAAEDRLKSAMLAGMHKYLHGSSASPPASNTEHFRRRRTRSSEY
jgi:hypothetical protein